MPRIASVADRLTVVRSMSHDDLDHGSATYLTDAFGLVMWPGVVPKVFSGEGTFDLDLGSGVFSSWMRVGEFDLTDRNYATGGLLILDSIVRSAARPDQTRGGA